MKKILLIYPKLEPSKSYHYMPITALAVAAELLAQGHDVAIWDDRAYNDTGKSLALLIIETEKIMLSAFTGYQLSEAYELAKLIKELHPDKKITLGGPHATALPEQTLESPYIDEVIQGEVDTGKQPLPYHLIDVMKYVNPQTKRFIAISSYSCVGICTFCQVSPRRKLIFLPLEKVKKDIDNLMELYDWKEVVWFDATIFTKPERALFIARLMKSHNLQWICDSRADEICRIDRNILDEIVSSGLKQITVGLESGSQRVVSTMKKGKHHLESYRKCAEIMSGYDITLASGVIFGTPGETPEDILQTIAYIKEIQAINKNFRISTTFYKPLPGTEMSKMCAKYGYKEPQSLEEWSKLGEESHYNYNSWDDVPWIENKQEYKTIYDDFKAKNSDLFI
jgi:radical SAM superfamily enzyme YgiQ (UPF0313 family)